METKSVDSDFEDFLKTPLEKNKERVKVTDEIPDEELEEDIPDKPISENTKKRIIGRFMNCLNSDPDNCGKIMNVLKNLDGLTEKEGLLYLKTLNAANLNHITDSAITLILKNLNDIMINPSRKDIKDAVLRDGRIRTTISNVIGDIFVEMGDLAGAILYVLYAAESYFKPYNEDEQKSKSDKPDSTV